MKKLSILLATLPLILVGCNVSNGKNGQNNNSNEPADTNEPTGDNEPSEPSKPEEPSEPSEPSTPVNPPLPALTPKDLITNVEELTILEGRKGQLTASSAKSQKVEKGLIYQVTKGEEIISVDENGLVTGLKVGQGEVTIKSNSEYVNDKVIPVNVIEQEEGIDEAFPINETPLITYKGVDTMSSVPTGNQKILVLPMCPSDYTKDATAENIELIRKAYYGTKEETNFISVKDYYYQASFGLLNYDITIGDEWYIAPDEYTYESIRDNNSRIEDMAIWALKQFEANHPDFDFDSFDADGDGYIDNLHYICAGKLNGFSHSGFVQKVWKMQDMDGAKWAHYAFIALENLTDKITYGFSSKTINPLTIIHENGHMLGLPDYYDYYSSGMRLTGLFDMQDNDTFDWNTFSKYTMDWIKPRYVDEDVLKEKKTATITLSSSSMDGDCLIIRNKNSNGSAFDEYILLELFNPCSGVNYIFNNKVKMEGFDDIGYGVKVFHVDARVVQDYWDNVTDTVITEIMTKDNIKDSTISSKHLINTNAGKQYTDVTGWPFNEIGEEFINFDLLHLLQKGNVNTFGSHDNELRKRLNNSDLWQTGDTFTIGEHEGFTDYGKNFFYKENKFNDNSEFPYGITFDKVTSDTATITITYLG